MSLAHRAFSEWLYKKYHWTYDYFVRVCSDSEQERIWDEFWKEMETKKP